MLTPQFFYTRYRLAKPCLRTPQKGRRSLNKFLSWKFKIWPKIQRVKLNNFRASGSILMKLFQSTCREAGVINSVQFLEGPSPKIWEGKKNRQKFGVISDNFQERIHISKIGKVIYQLQPHPRWMKKVGILWSINEKSLMCIDHNVLFRQTTFRPLGGADPSNFYTRQRLTKHC